MEALERAVVARQALAAGDRDTALMLADLEVRALRDAESGLRGKVAFVTRSKTRVTCVIK